MAQYLCALVFKACGSASQIIAHGIVTDQLDAAHQRIVLSDWDASATPPRAEVLRLSLSLGVFGLQRIALQ